MSSLPKLQLAEVAASGSGAPCWLISREPRRAGGVLSPSDKEVIYVSPRAPPPLAPGGALRRRPHSAATANSVNTATAAAARYSERRIPEADIEEPEDVIDLGAPPRRLFRRASEGIPAQRRRRRLTPNPRLYPGPKPKPQPRPHPVESKRARRGKRNLRPIPNSRLYRPGPPRLPPSPPPPARPRTHWPPPPPASASLDTASNVVLRRLRYLPERSPSSPAESSLSPRTQSPCKQSARKQSPRRRTQCTRSPRTRSPRLPTPPRSLTPELSNQRALVVTLPSARAPRYHYQPASEHFRARQSATARSNSPPPAALPRARPAKMEAASAEDRSEGNETLSAPSEFLAEFLSAILRRQYAEALKYCRLILQYEPHNATAQSFYPLLRQKLRAGSPSPAPSPSPPPAHSASPLASSPPTLDSDEEPPPPAEPPDHMDRGSSSEDEDQSDLELDSSHDSSPSLTFSHHTNRTEYSTSGSAAGCSGGAGGGWESSGSGGGERSASAPPPPDDNGNPPAPPSRLTLCARPPLTADDLENDNASAGGEPHQSSKSDSVSSLRRLRAQFACSIK